MTREQIVLRKEAEENEPGYHARESNRIPLMQMTPTLACACGVDPGTELARVLFPASRRPLARHA